MRQYRNIFYNCKKATFLIDKRNLEGISPLQQIELRLHLLGCSVCRLYQSQSRMVDQMVRDFYTNSFKPVVGLDAGFKKGLEEEILKELKKTDFKL